MAINTFSSYLQSEGIFIGRQAEYEKLKRLIQENKVVIIEGFSGIGKTSLALHYAHDNLANYNAVVWYEIQADDNLRSIIESISGNLKAQDQGFLHNAIWGQQQTARSAINALSDQLKRARILLIFDSFENFLDDIHNVRPEFKGLVKELFTASFNSRILLTTKIKPKLHPSLLGQYSPFELSGLANQDTTELLSELARKHNIVIDPGHIYQLHKITEGHPLALYFIVAALSHGDTLQMLLKDLQHVLVSDVAPYLLQILYPKLTLEAQKLLVACSVFRKPITMSEIKYLPVNTTYFAELKSFFFIDLDLKKQHYTLHPIVREYAYKKLKQDKSKYVYFHKSIGDYYINQIKAAKDLENFETVPIVLEAIHHCHRGNHSQGQLFLGDFIAKNRTPLRKLVKFGEDRLAKRLYEAVLRVKSDDSEMHQFYARLLEHFDADPIEIEKHYAEAVRLTPSNSERQMDYLVFLAKTGRYDVARANFEKAMQLPSCRSNEKVYVPYARNLIEAQRNNEAEKVLEKALPYVAPSSLSPVYIMYCQALERQQKFEKLENAFDKAIKTVPIANGLDDVYLKYCQYLARHRKYDRAVSIVQDGIRKLPQKRIVELYVEHSKILRQQGKDQEAIATLEEGIKKIPSKFNLYSLYWEYCDLLKSTKDFTAAIDILRRGMKAVSLEHKGDALILEYSKVVSALGNREEAESALRYGIQNTPAGEGLKILYLDYSNLLLYQRRYDEALSLLDSALTSLPKRSHSVIKRKRNEIAEERNRSKRRQNSSPNISLPKPSKGDIFMKTDSGKKKLDVFEIQAETIKRQNRPKSQR